MQTYQSLLTENFIGFATMILIHKVNQYFGKQVPISASLHMVIVKTMNFPNRDQVDQLKKWQRSFDQMRPALPENELLVPFMAVTIYTLHIIHFASYI